MMAEYYSCMKRTAVVGILCYVVIVLGAGMYPGYYNHFSVFHNHFRPNIINRQTGSSNGSNNFLDGLIEISKFDRESCISRHESYKYRKPSPYKPSSYLISKLRNYEKLHKRCGEDINRRLQTNVADDEAVNLNGTCKYVIWRPITASNGLGNRILSLASTFVYALLTDRVLLVEFSGSLDGLFCEPFPSSSWLLPRDLDLPSKKDSTLGSVYHWLANYLPIHIQEIPTIEELRRMNTTGGGRGPLFVQVILKGGYPDKEDFHCSDSQTTLRDIPVITLQSDVYFVPSLFMASSFQQELNKLFPEEASIAHLLGHYLYHPSNEAWETIAEFYNAYLADAHQRVGLQLRLFHENVPHSTYLKQLLSCTSSYNLLPDLRKEVKSKSSTVNQNSTSGSSKTVVLVASLYSVFAESLKSIYSSNHLLDHEVTVYQSSHEERQRSRNNKHNMKAWVDMYLLSLCDVIVTSAESTFGYVAQTLGGLTPWILTMPTDEHVPTPPCRQGLSMEPCLHGAPKLDCKTKAEISNITAVFPHIQPCEDRWGGVKLISTGNVQH